MVERCLGKAKVPGPNPGQGLLVSTKGERIGLFDNCVILPNIVRSPRQRSTKLSYQDSNRNSIDEEFWVTFQEYLLKIYNKHTAKVRLLYSKKYYHILTESNAQVLLTLSNDKRIHAMKSLAALSKYLGCYDLWKDIIERYQLKWSNEDAVRVFHNITNTDHDFSSMVKWLKDAYSKLPKSYGNILLFNALTDLRPEESIQSIKILHNNESDDYLKDNTILDNYIGMTITPLTCIINGSFIF